MQYESVIGLEVHVQLLTNTKIFCNCSTKFGSAPNTQVCPVCLGMPGTLPVLNYKAVEYALRAALATNCRINQRSIWARKNYFYPDLPKNYQISMYELPLAEHGQVDIIVNNKTKSIGISRIHMEEDAGKLIHDYHQGKSCIDLNRTGIPLIEIVSEPVIQTSEQAVAYLKALRNILVYLDICNGNLEEGSFRCDANVSVRPLGQINFGTRTELKNINSFRFIAKALEYEIRRQQNMLEDGIAIAQETRFWDSRSDKTISIRGKEEPHDYCYFPDPDLMPLIIDQSWINKIQANLPELPDAKRVRFIQQYNLSNYDAIILTANRSLSDYFEAVVKAGATSTISSNWIIYELLGILNSQKRDIEHILISSQKLAELLIMLERGNLSRKIARDIFVEMFITGRDAATIMKEKNFQQINDIKEVEELIAKIISVNPEQVSQFKNGKEKVLRFFIGQVMKETRGQVDPVLINEIIRKLLT